MNKLSQVQVGFEIEFCHDWSFAEIKNDLRTIFPDPWRVYKTRLQDSYLTYETKESAKKCFSLTDDASIRPNYDDENTVELITPVWSYNSSLKKLWMLFEWMEDTGANTNHSTGLHVNLSYPKMAVDPRLVVLKTNDRYWLTKFQRMYNDYCKPQTKKVDLEEKHRSINFLHKKYIEFRIIGGYDYHLRRNDVFSAIHHFATALIESKIR